MKNTSQNVESQVVTAQESTTIETPIVVTDVTTEAPTEAPTEAGTLAGNLKKNDIYGIDIPVSWSKEIEIFGKVFDTFRAKRVNYSTLLAEAISLRESYGLKAYSELSAGTSKNFDNRLARFIGGTYESGTKATKQAKFFNCEIRTGQKVTGFLFPIVASAFLSPQVKADDQTFVLPRKLVKQAKGNISIEDIAPE